MSGRCEAGLGGVSGGGGVHEGRVFGRGGGGEGTGGLGRIVPAVLWGDKGAILVVSYPSGHNQKQSFILHLCVLQTRLLSSQHPGESEGT